MPKLNIRQKDDGGRSFSCNLKNIIFAKSDNLKDIKWPSHLCLIRSERIRGGVEAPKPLLPDWGRPPLHNSLLTLKRLRGEGGVAAPKPLGADYAMGWRLRR